MRILIADDEEMNREILSELIGFYGECVTVTDGEEAVNEYNTSLNRKMPYDLICLDIMMPKLDGQGALKVIRMIEQKRDIKAVKVIMTTAVSDRQNVLKAIAEGKADYYLIKPIQETVLQTALKEIGLVME
ncbi:response regulator [candidate division KSB1 bacterium]|nr:response regulator [candidate division KSB1 bacterium]